MAVEPHESRSDSMQLQIRGNVADVCPISARINFEYRLGEVCRSALAGGAARMRQSFGEVVQDDELVLHAGHRML